MNSLHHLVLFSLVQAVLFYWLPAWQEVHKIKYSLSLKGSFLPAELLALYDDKNN